MKVTIGDTSSTAYSTTAGGTGSGSKQASSSSSSNHVTEAQQTTSTAFQGGVNSAGKKFLEYFARTTKPTPDDKCWLKYPTYGYDQAMEITYSWRYTNGSCLPNCVGYMWGRVYELSKQYGTELPTTRKLSVYNAKTCYGHNKNAADAYARGDYPRLGAVICFDSSSAGHVAIVEKINFKKDGTIENVKISEGAYAQYVFNNYTVRPENNYNYSSHYPTQGFVYPPYCGLFSPDGKASDLGLQPETIVVIENAIAKYIQTWKSNYSKEDPGFDPTEPPTAPPAQDSNGTPISAGNKIKVIGKGNTSKTGKGKDIDEIGMEYSLKSYHPGFPFPYRLSNGSRGVGYWSESAIKKL